MIVIVSVERAQHELECRQCRRPIRAGQRAVLVLGTGQVHLRCLLAQRTLVGDREGDETAQDGDETAHDQTSAADVAAAQPRRND